MLKYRLPVFVLQSMITYTKKHISFKNLLNLPLNYHYFKTLFRNRKEGYLNININLNLI